MGAFASQDSSIYSTLYILISSVKNDVYKRKFCSLHKSGSLRLGIFRAELACVLESRPVQLGIQPPLGPAMLDLSSHTADLYIAHSYRPACAMTLYEVLDTHMSQVLSWHSQVTDRGGIL